MSLGGSDAELVETERPIPRDTVGSETLAIMHAAGRYNAWQYGRIAPYLGHRICEIGSGIGNMSELLLAESGRHVVLTDQDEAYLDIVRRKFSANPSMRVERLDLPDQGAAERFKKYQLDTVVALNVIEHIEDDLGSFATIRSMLEPGGTLIVLVPALPVLQGSLDDALGHYRRYTLTSLGALLVKAGFLPTRVSYFNLLGAIGWWFNARVLRRRRIDLFQVRCFDALVPLLRLEDSIRPPFGQSVIGIATRT